MPDPAPLTDAMLAAAVRKASEVGLLPGVNPYPEGKDYQELRGIVREALRENVRAVVRAALDAREETTDGQ